MGDENIRAQLAVIIDKVSDQYTAHLEERESVFRRSIEVSGSFYEKLSALDAGSIAVAVSVGAAFVAKPPFNIELAHWLVAIILCFWASLVCAVVHNFLVVRIAQSEKDITNANALERLYQFSTDVLAELDAPEAATSEDEQSRRETMTRKVRRLYEGRDRKRDAAGSLGYFSLGLFLLGYTLVVIKLGLMVFLR